jgi:hypothetical protein
MRKKKLIVAAMAALAIGGVVTPVAQADPYPCGAGFVNPQVNTQACRDCAHALSQGQERVCYDPYAGNYPVPGAPIPTNPGQGPARAGACALGGPCQ